MANSTCSSSGEQAEWMAPSWEWRTTRALEIKAQSPFPTAMALYAHRQHLLPSGVGRRARLIVSVDRAIGGSPFHNFRQRPGYFQFWRAPAYPAAGVERSRRQVKGIFCHRCVVPAAPGPVEATKAGALADADPKGGYSLLVLRLGFSSSDIGFSAEATLSTSSTYT